MLNKLSHLVVVRNFDGKRISGVLTVRNNDNLVSQLRGVSHLESANIADSKKAAYELSNFWNECYKKNGTLYDWR